MTNKVFVNMEYEQASNAGAAIAAAGGRVWHRDMALSLVPGNGGLGVDRAATFYDWMLDVDTSEIPAEFVDDFTKFRDTLADALDAPALA